MAISKLALALAASLFLPSGQPPLPARLERPGAFPSAAAPAPETPLPARANGERELRVGALRVHVAPAPSTEARGEWSDELQPPMFRLSVERAPGA